MPLVKSLVTTSSFTPEREYRLETVPNEVGPSGDPVLRCTLFDGATGAGSAAPNERQEVQWGLRLEAGVEYWAEFHLRFVELPSWSPDRWFDWLQAHDTDGSPQAPWQADLGPGSSTDHRMRMNLTRGTSRHSYTDLGPAVTGVWRHVVIGWRASVGGDGFMKITVDGVVKMDYHGPTADSATRWYGKAGGYRNAVVNGRSIHEYSGMRVWSLESDVDGVVTPPAPDMLGPALTVTRPQINERFENGTITWAATATDPSGVKQVEFSIDETVISTEKMAPYGDSSPLRIPAGILAGSHMARIRAIDNAGNASEVAISIEVGPEIIITPPVDIPAVIDRLDMADGAVALAASHIEAARRILEGS